MYVLRTLGDACCQQDIIRMQQAACWPYERDSTT